MHLDADEDNQPQLAAFETAILPILAALRPPEPSEEMVEALFRSQSFSAGHGPGGEFVTLNFKSRKDREAFLDAYIAALKARAAISSLEGGGKG